jgi:hypothetical protein
LFFSIIGCGGSGGGASTGNVSAGGGSGTTNELSTSNDDVQSAQTILIGSKIAGSLTAGVDHADFFKFTLSQAQTIKMVLSDTTISEITFQLFNEDYSVRISPTLLNGEKNATASLSANTYYIRVFTTDSSGNYTLSLSEIE